MNWNTLLPRADTSFEGPKSAYYFLILVTVADTVRSLIHMFAPDGGAHSIAGLDIRVAGGANLIAIFSQWGASQLMLAILYWIVILRYRFLVPIMLLFVVVEQALRISVGHLKPLVVASPAPGAIGSKLLLPVTAAVFLWSLRSAPIDEVRAAYVIRRRTLAPRIIGCLRRDRRRRRTLSVLPSLV